MMGLLGERDEYLRVIESAFSATSIGVRGNLITLEGPEAPVAQRVFEELVAHLERGLALDTPHIARTIEMVRANLRPSEITNREVLRSANGKGVRPQTPGQRRYVDAIAKHTVTFGIGPAGSGKSYLAVALAVQALQAKQISRIILTRPAVEAGERLGFLPGDLMAKVDPYLRPLYDALNDMLEPEGTLRLIERGIIEIAPLAFMRGRTLNSSFVILDEAQNTTPEQMKMFLTRIGFGTKAVITGDVTQVDIAQGRSGLLGLERILTDVEDLSFIHLDNSDVVRHKIVRDIVAAYDRDHDQKVARGEAERAI
jgi:phosphate starvation-inducible PhoH-like protein